MKKALAFLFCAVALPAVAQSAPVTLTLFSLLGKCTASVPAIPFWTGTTFVCATLGPGLTYNATTGQLNTTSAGYTPVWQVETVSFANATTGATSMSYTTLKPVVAGVILYYYSVAGMFSNSFGAVATPAVPPGTAATTQQVTIPLPTGWQPTDGAVLIYASQ